MSYELGFAMFFTFFFIYLFIYFLIVTVFNYVCVSAFEQGNLDPWRTKSAVIIIIIINSCQPIDSTRNNVTVI